MLLIPSLSNLPVLCVAVGGQHPQEKSTKDTENTELHGEIQIKTLLLYMVP